MATTHGHLNRLSALPDAMLARILSYLSTDQAARSSALSRRWRRVNTTVHLVDCKTGDRQPNSEQPVCFDHQVTSALIFRDLTAPIRAFRVDVFHPTTSLLDQWIVIALTAGAEEVDVKLRYWDSSRRRLCPFGPYKGSSVDFDYKPKRVSQYIKTPRHLFGTSTLRRLCLTNWTLDVPRDVSSFVSLETRVLKRIMAPGNALQRLVLNCPSLVDLVLEECLSATEITVACAHLQRLAMVCCHNATRVMLETPHLRSLHYKGGLPPETFFSLPNHGAITSVTIDICEDIKGKKATEVAPMTKLIGRCTNLTFLHLSLRPEMAYYSGLFTSVLRGLSHLRQLELKGCLHGEGSAGSVGAIAVLLQNTHKLEVLSLFPLLPGPPKKEADDLSDSDDELPEDGDDRDGYIGACAQKIAKH